MRPMYEMLRAAAGRESFHMPGHKGRAPLGAVDLYALDATELPRTDDLYAPERGIAQAQRLYARAAGAACSLMLTNGSTMGMHVMLQLYAREGDTVLLPRDAHLSAVNACIMGGLRVRWIPAAMTADGLCHICEADVLTAMAQYPQARALLLTRPDYYGGCIALERIARAAHERGIRLVVDEAHGAHFPWLAGVQSAGACGADAWVQSVHKTLPGLTGAAVLHLADEADRPAAVRLLRRGQTSSPSFVHMLSIDDAREYMDLYGRERLSRVVAAADALRRKLPVLGYADAHGAWREVGLTFDPTRMVIDAPQGGAALADALAERGVDVEMHDLRRVVLILTAMDEPEDILHVADVLATIPPTPGDIEMLPPLTALPPRAMEVRPAAMAPCENVPLTQCEGRIAAVSAGLYPPGIPLICPGETITAEVVRRLTKRKQQECFGVEGDTLICVSV